MKNKITNKLHESVDKSSEALEQADRLIRKSPYKASAVMLGVGLVVGALAGFILAEKSRKK